MVILVDFVKKRQLQRSNSRLQAVLCLNSVRNTRVSDEEKSTEIDIAYFHVVQAPSSPTNFLAPSANSLRRLRRVRSCIDGEQYSTSIQATKHLNMSREHLEHQENPEEYKAWWLAKVQLITPSIPGCVPSIPGCVPSIPGCAIATIFWETTSLTKSLRLWLCVNYPFRFWVCLKGLTSKTSTSSASSAGMISKGRLGHGRTYLEPKWPLFLKVNPPEQGPFQAKQGSFGF